MWITKEMEKDFEEITWIPWANGFIPTLEYISDQLALIGYSVEIKKIGE